MMDSQKTLLKLMSLPTSKYDGVIKTSDGMYLAKVKGDVGYNAFIGRPAPLHLGAGRDFMMDTWNGLTAQEKSRVVALAKNPTDGYPIDLAGDFGVPVERDTEFDSIKVGLTD